jgi:hypothetical protein
MILTYTIDPEVSVMDLLGSFKQGDHTVLDKLEQDHPGLTALFLTLGCTERLLSIGDVNTVANYLKDKRRQRLLESEAKER